MNEERGSTGLSNGQYARFIDVFDPIASKTIHLSWDSENTTTPSINFWYKVGAGMEDWGDIMADIIEELQSDTILQSQINISTIKALVHTLLKKDLIKEIPQEVSITLPTKDKEWKKLTYKLSWLQFFNFLINSLKMRLKSKWHQKLAYETLRKREEEITKKTSKAQEWDKEEWKSINETIDYVRLLSKLLLESN